VTPTWKQHNRNDALRWRCHYDNKWYWLILKARMKGMVGYFYQGDILNSHVRYENENELFLPYEADHLPSFGDPEWDKLAARYVPQFQRWAEGFLLSPMELLTQALTCD